MLHLRAYRIVVVLMASGLACDGDPAWLSAVGQSCFPRVRIGSGVCAPGATPPVTSGCFRRDEIFSDDDNADCAGGTCLVNYYDEAADRDGAARAQRVYCSCRCGVTVGLGSRLEANCACPEGTVCRRFDGAGFTYAHFCVRPTP